VVPEKDCRNHEPRPRNHEPDSMKTKHISVIGIIILSMMFMNAKAQSSPDKESARIFVQKFYDWYYACISANTPGNKNAKLFTFRNVVIQKPEYFDVSLRKALIDDNEAQSKSNEIVGLDFDPFLNAQDVGLKYTAMRVKQDGDKFLVNVHTTNAAQSNNSVIAFKLAVIAEVIKKDSGWQFVNFIYPSKDGGTNLLSVLDPSGKNSGEKKN
jgi:hypothetical protein